MAYVSRNGARLHYRVSGTGPVIALQHALTSDSSSFEAVGWRGDLIASGFTCVTMDSIGHGKSDSPEEAGRYVLSEQADDLVAVLDEIGAETFGLVGYSMGAWISSGVLTKQAHRVTHAVLGGWDPIRGARLFTEFADDQFARAEDFRLTVKALFEMRPGAPTATPTQMKAYVTCYQRLFEPIPPLETLKSGDAHLGFFCGEKDPYEPNVRRAATSLHASYLATRGDHLGGFVAREAIAFIRATLREGGSTSEPRRAP